MAAAFRPTSPQKIDLKGATRASHAETQVKQDRIGSPRARVLEMHMVDFKYIKTLQFTQHKNKEQLTQP
jgi:hypothetical protein